MSKARKTAKEIREEESLLLKQLQKKEKGTEDQSKALFENIEKKKEKQNATYEEIKKTLEEKANGRQGSFYLNEPLMKLFRRKVVMEDTNIAEVVRHLLVEYYFTEEELREVYNIMEV